MKLEAVERARLLVIEYDQYNLSYFERKLMNSLIAVVEVVDELKGKEAKLKEQLQEEIRALIYNAF